MPPRTGQLIAAQVAAIAFLGIPAVYFLSIDLTKTSFLNALSASELVELAGFLLSGTAVAAVVLCGFCVLASKLLSSAGVTVLPSKLLQLSSAAIIALFTCVVVENFAYTTLHFGLKTSEGRFLKLAYIAISLFVGKFAYGLFSDLSSARILHHARAKAILVAYSGAALIVLIVTSGMMQSNAAREKSKVVIGNPYNIVILSSDGLSASRLGFFGYTRETTPFLNSIKAEFLYGSNAFSNNANTTGSITSLLTGRLPTRTRVVYAPDAMNATEGKRSLPALLRSGGYFTSNYAVPFYADARSVNMFDAFDMEFGIRVAGESGLFSLVKAPNQKRYLVSAHQQWLELLKDMAFIAEAPNVFDQVTDAGKKAAAVKRTLFEIKKSIKEIELDRLDTVRSIITTKDKFFSYTHFMLSHGPVFAISDGVFSSGKPQLGKWMTDFYDDAVLAFDQKVKLIYGDLKEAGKLEDTILIVTSDHPMRYDPTQRIPILIRFPNLSRTGDIPQNIQSIDIAATIVDALGVAKPDWMQGSSLMRHESISPNRPIFTGQYGAKVMAADKDRQSLKAQAPELGSLGSLWLRVCNQILKLDMNSIPATLTKKVDTESDNCSTSATGVDQDISAEEILNTELKEAGYRN
jgi:arylsulfatase A-like enzyme